MAPSSSRLAAWRAPALALGAGALAVLAFAPFGWYLLAPLALALLYEALRGRRGAGAFGIGWAFGLGLMGLGVFWIRISMNQFGNMDAWAANLLAGLFIAVVALYYGLAGWLIARLDRGPAWVGPLLALPGAWVLFEWLRGWLFTGFPWLAIGYSQVDGPLAGFAPLVGVYGLGLVVAVAGGLLWVATLGAQGRPPWARWGALAALALLYVVGAALAPIPWSEARGAPLRAAVLQGNVPQSLKWDESARLPTIENYIDLTIEHLDNDVLVWPETALPDFLDRLREPLIEPLAERLREEGVDLVFGVPVRDAARDAYYNGLASIGTAEGLYYKRHLVPFGEFLPFRPWLGPIVEWFEVPMSDFSRGPMARPLIQVDGLPVGVSICYEDAFPTELGQALPEAAYLINVSNDGWFGDSLAPHQHLQIARMRALENARPLLRATNTGISAIIDYRGRLLGIVPAFERGAFGAAIQPRSGATPFVRLGNVPAVALATLLLAAAAFLAGRRPGTPPGRAG
ncbi:apolipoprotein N-acyltransferase [Thiococcus pfennigii]|uniref:apolipoprotein N-acyltransferase n=1 Tax=Thiococcus pfennigii TaxID=1057 RepID=UPI001906EDD3|nr:apolipoprotein N-acyltransferase [Thiococcus pfennigii]MBK1702373.1 apolipoprotein N-acyltransferase [Thiococcus pfennigii]MBK1733446.1 apolipoprotein N-acyltransferase [Thiococcus pfennigii]